MTSIPSRPVKRGIDQLLENIRAIQDQWQIDPTTMYNVGQWMACLAHPASCMARDSRTSGAEEVHSELNWRNRIKLPEVCFKHIVRPLCRRCVPSNYAGCEAWTCIFWERAEFSSAMMMHFLFFNRSSAPACQNTGWFVVTGQVEHYNSVAPSQRSTRVDTVWLPPLPFSMVISVKPHAGSNEQYAGEGIFLTQHRDS